VKALRAAAACVVLIWYANAGAIVFEQREFDDAEQLERYKTLTYELRCLVCQNQNLADSDADLAADLRREVYRMIREGKSNEDVVDFMVARYGDFVLYRPPLKAKTVALWAAPFVLGIGGVMLLLVHLRRRPAARAAAAPLSAEEQARLQSLLDADRDG
jgi:cytochrome c-type biogenesis protein CcmH